MEMEEKKEKSNVKELAIKRRGKPNKTVKIRGGAPEKEKEIKKEKVEKSPEPKFMKKDEFERVVRERLSGNNSITKGICKLKDINFDSENEFETITRIIEVAMGEAEKKGADSGDRAYIEPI